MKIHILGVGDTFTETHNSTALLIESDGFYLAIDCPDSYRRVLALTCQVPLPQINHFLITHCHGDHMNGLEGVVFYKRFVEQVKPTLICTETIQASIWDRLAPAMTHLKTETEDSLLGFSDYFDYQRLDEAYVNRIGPFQIWPFLTHHHIPTTALLIRDGNSSLGYSADTAYDPYLIQYLSQADLIIHETNHGAMHTPIAALEALPSVIRDKMHLIHYPDGTESSIPLCHEGQVILI
jgi:ribonuclease BN (tRNA processing enzyme)